MNKEAWQEEAFAALRRWSKACHRLQIRAGYVKGWTVESARAWITRLNVIEEPRDLRWWGPVVQRALREKIIRQKGWGRAKSSHGARKATYVGTKYA